MQKIFGPGNAYVVAAKRLVFGHVAIDLLPGPSELLVLADDTANPKFAAADMLAQAEHGTGHERVWLVTTSGRLLKAVGKELARQLPKLARRELIKQVLDRNGWLIQVETLEDAVELANQLAPEHCEVMTRKAGDLEPRHPHGWGRSSSGHIRPPCWAITWPARTIPCRPAELAPRFPG